MTAPPTLALAGQVVSVTHSPTSVRNPAYLTSNAWIHQANSNNLIAYLGELPDPTMAGGYKGEFDLSWVICDEGDPCEVRLGLTGTSIPGPLFNLNLDMLFGDKYVIPIELGDTIINVSLAGGMEICLNETCFKEGYCVTGAPGNRVAWGIGGKLNLADVLEVLGPVISGEDIDLGAILGAMTSMAAGFYSAVVPNVEIEPIPMVPDLADINGDGDFEDLVPDCDNFPMLPGGDMLLKIPAERTVTLDVGSLPEDGQGGWLYDGVFVIGGVLVRDAGFVPLGFAAAMDAPTDNDTANGFVESIELKFSCATGTSGNGLPGLVVILVLLSGIAVRRRK